VGNAIYNDGVNVSRAECAQAEQSIISNSSCVGNSKHDGSHQRGEETRGEDSSSEQGWMQEPAGGSSSVGDSEGWSNGQQPTEQQGWNTSGRSGEESGAMGNASMLDGTGQAGGQWEPPRVVGNSNSIDRSASPEGWQHDSEVGSASNRQTQPSLGGDSDGSAYRMDDAELFLTSDNRTDELRLLGNGVVPATATRAFLTLMDQLLNENA